MSGSGEPASTLIERIDAWALRVSKLKPVWWAWPAAMFVLGTVAASAALLFAPGPDESVLFLGTEQFFGACGFLEATGLPCPSCGMTRSWVHSARGNLLTGFTYSPAGALLFWWLVATGALGAARLVMRDGSRWAVPHVAIAAGAIFWMVGPYLAVWAMRIAGWIPAP